MTRPARRTLSTVLMVMVGALLVAPARAGMIAVTAARRRRVYRD
jgi:hypothetical protein